MAKRQKVEASGVDFLLLCEDIVHKMEADVKRRKVDKSETMQIFDNEALRLGRITRMDSEGSGVLRSEIQSGLCTLFVGVVSKLREGRSCCEAMRRTRLVCSAFQHNWHKSNWHPFDYVRDCINTWSFIFIDCMRELLPTITSMPYLGPSQGTIEDEEELRKKLEDLASERSNSSFRIFGFFLPDQAALKQQHLARFLLKRKPYSRVGSTLEDLNTVFLWEKENEPVGTWGDVKFLGARSGASGVLKASWLGVPCAKKEFHGEVSEAMFLKEVGIMAQFNHPCIVDFICYGNGEGRGDRFIAMELMEKSLFDLIKEQKGVHFSLEVALDIISQIATGVEYLHRMGVAHRDLKPHNVVVNTLRSPYHEDYYCVKLVDFGTCKSEVEASKSNTISYRGIGTTRYRAPEVHPSAHPEGLGKVNWFEADAYSFAMTCAHLLTLKEPYEELETLSTLYTEIFKGRRPILPRRCPKELIDLVEQCWSTMRSKRPSFLMICEKLKKIKIQNLQQFVSNFIISMDHSKNKNPGTYDIKEEQCHIKEEGHTSYFTAQDVSLYNEVVSRETDSKQDVVSRLEGAKTKVEDLETV